MRPKPIRAIIIGGGIGGLTASIALRNEGFSTPLCQTDMRHRSELNLCSEQGGTVISTV
jgi:cation diffusion facilitator CzcD-associated flavoprotein CzcO